MLAPRRRAVGCAELHGCNFVRVIQPQPQDARPREHCARRRGCWWHALTISTFEAQRDEHAKRLEHEAIGYASESADFIREHRRPTFKAVLVGLARG